MFGGRLKNCFLWGGFVFRRPFIFYRLKGEQKTFGCRHSRAGGNPPQGNRKTENK
ncbi:hypothetical protein NEIPOLOT_00186 [Neisseria polysaccharea ATCC 43768]|nr:hypothetical protein NEIPOLOT_00186 [Neisseria polysaccharea ATCC 43768]